MQTSLTAKSYLHFFIDKQAILLSIDSIRMVLAFATLQETPDQDVAFKGMLNFHGKGVPVYDLSTLINRDKKITIDEDTPLLLANADNQDLGLIVSAVTDMMSIESSLLQAPPQDAMPYVSHIYETEKEASWVLDLNTLVVYHRLHLQSEMPHE